jgi:pimeloyl-ACP methyl ester carboxylesterase
LASIADFAFAASAVTGFPMSEASAEPWTFPAGFRTQDIQTDGATIHVRVGGRGSAVVLIHGFGDTGDMWVPLAEALMADHTVVVPDLRGMGLSSHPPGGYDKKTQARDIARVLDTLGIGPVDLVTHDIGNMVGYAFAAQYPERVTRYIAMDAPLPGIGPWDEITRSPLLWHFNFRGPDVERLVEGRERIYLDRFYNELSANPKAIEEATRRHYASLYARPGAMHAAFNQFAAFTQDAADNKAFEKTKLTMPILALGGDHSFGTQMAEIMRLVATDVTAGVITNSGHWVMEEQPQQTTAKIVAFIDKN